MKKITIPDIMKQPELCINPLTGIERTGEKNKNAKLLPDDWNGTIVDLLHEPVLPMNEMLYATNWFLTDSEKQRVGAKIIISIETLPADWNKYATRILDGKQLTKAMKKSVLDHKANKPIERTASRILTKQDISKSYKHVLQYAIARETLSADKIRNIVSDVVS